MATSTVINLSPNVTPDFTVSKLDNSALGVAQETLQRNHDETHIFFNAMGFHNHIAHYVLNLWALGADAKIIQEQFKLDMAMQKPLESADPAVVTSFEDADGFIAGMAKPANYPNYLAFFHKQLAARPWQEVIAEFILKQDRRGKIMFNRFYSSIVHPWIHLALGVEFAQPAIIAEALAETAVHEEWLDVFFERSDEIAAANPPEPKSMLHLLQALHDDALIKSAPRSTDRPPKRFGIIGRALPQMAQYAAQWRVDPAKLPEAAAELTNAAMFTMAGAQVRGKKPKMDFALMHNVTSTIGLATFLRQAWISDADKARLLEGKGRADLMEYAAAKSPALHLDAIADHPVSRSWDEIAAEALQRRQDGHVPKLIRAIMHGEKVCRPFEGALGDRFAIKGDMWLKLANLAIDSVSDDQFFWIFGAGFPEVWERQSGVHYA